MVSEDTEAKNKVPVSFVVPIKNEAANLPRCLSSISWADEIFVVDSQSTDGSQQIAIEHGAQVVQFSFNGTWPKKNWALDNLPFKHDWVFILDADEVMPPESRQEILEIVAEPLAADNDVVGYFINRRFYFMGKCLKHAYQPNWNLRLFKHRLGRFEKLTDADTQSGDNEVHEHIIIAGKTKFLQSVMEHYSFPSVDVFMEKHNRYSNWEARVALQPTQSNLDAHSGKPQGWRRRLKLIALALPCRPLLRFLYVYFLEKGFLDGIEGYYFARMHGVYELMTIAKTFELRKTLLTSKQAGNR